MQTSLKKVGIFGYYGDLNLGEEATIEAVIYNIRRFSPDAVIQCFSIFPADSRDRYHLDAFPIQYVSEAVLESRRLRETNEDVSPCRIEANHVMANSGFRSLLKRVYPLVLTVRFLRGLKRSLVATLTESRFACSAWSQLRDIDLLMIVGSNQCFDFCGGPWHYPYTLLKWTVLAKLTDTKVAFTSVGAGPIISPLSKLMIRCALAMADYRSFRDNVSKRVIDDIFAGHSSDRVVPDLAFSMPDTITIEQRDSVNESVVIAINPMPMYDDRYWPEADNKIYQSLIDKYISLTEWIDGRGYRFFFYATHPKDALMVKDMRQRMGADRFEFRDDAMYPAVVSDLMTRISQADVAVAMRFHGIVLPYVVCKPVLGLEYWEKTKDLMSYMGQSEYCVPKEDFLYKTTNFNLDSITSRLERLIQVREQEANNVRENLRKCRDKLDEQYQRLLTAPKEKLRVSHAYR